MQGPEAIEAPRGPDRPGEWGRPDELSPDRPRVSGGPDDGVSGSVVQVPGTRTGLLRRVAALPDGRRITYYRLPAAGQLPAAGPDSPAEARRGVDGA
ncbi:hypothetical protein [Frankia sp. R82]|uniref:hypothetical protein n=1 Tax=Frankia sp. R82 TaxID=2950553 RepID=UPI0020438BF5|nr:hypothetical protein [Frankia sp. R82]MCM3885578.1 hypothetical protein [Frankia sp. R82]